MTKQELKELIKDVLAEARYNKSDKEFISNWTVEGNRYIEEFISDLYNRRGLKDKVLNYFKSFTIPEIEKSIKKFASDGEYDRASYGKKILNQLVNKMPFYDVNSLETYITEWILDKYPKYKVSGGYGDLSSSAKIGYSLKSIIENENKTIEQLEDEFVEWYKTKCVGKKGY